MNISSHIDHTILKQTTGKKDIETVCREAMQYGFAAVCIPPVYIHQAFELLKESSIKIATVIGFPFGYTYISAKEKEALQAIEDGAQELDMVMNVGALKDNNHDYLRQEVQTISNITQQNNVKLKVIIESGILTNVEIIKCCDIYKEYNVDFLKTSTGYAEKGASIEAVQLMRRYLPSHIQIKASGGIRTYEFAKQLIEAGATRLGCSASVAITKGENAGAGNY